MENTPKDGMNNVASCLILADDLALKPGVSDVYVVSYRLSDCREN